MIVARAVLSGNPAHVRRRPGSIVGLLLLLDSISIFACWTASACCLGCSLLPQLLLSSHCRGHASPGNDVPLEGTLDLYFEYMLPNFLCFFMIYQNAK